MGSVNKVILIGNLGADPEVRYTAGGQAVANLRIATTEKWRDRDNNVQEKTEWHRVVVWGKSAEHCRDYLRKGRQVYIEGSLETREWQDRDGQKRFTTEVKARQVVFLGGRDGGGAPSEGGYGGGGGGGGYGGGGGGGYGGGGGGGYGGGPSGGGPSGGGPSGGGYGGRPSGGYGGPSGGPGPNRGPAPSEPPPPDDGYFQEGPDGLSDDDIPF